MEPTTIRTLAALGNVGKTPVTVRVSDRLFSPALISECARHYAHHLSADSHGYLTIAPAGEEARESLRRFTNDLLAAVRELQ